MVTRHNPREAFMIKERDKKKEIRNAEAVALRMTLQKAPDTKCLTYFPAS